MVCNYFSSRHTCGGSAAHRTRQVAGCYLYVGGKWVWLGGRETCEGARRQQGEVVRIGKSRPKPEQELAISIRVIYFERENVEGEGHAESGEERTQWMCFRSLLMLIDMAGEGSKVVFNLKFMQELVGRGFN